MEWDGEGTDVAEEIEEDWNPDCEIPDSSSASSFISSERGDGLVDAWTGRSGDDDDDSWLADLGRFGVWLVGLIGVGLADGAKNEVDFPEERADDDEALDTDAENDVEEDEEDNEEEEEAGLRSGSNSCCV